jgi:putative transposase
MSVPERRAMVERPSENLSVRRQCELLNLARSGVYRPAPVAGAVDLALMQRIDELHLKWPFYGSRRMMFELNQAGHGINRKRVQGLMRVTGIEALVPRPGTSKAAPGHKIYPYLLRGVAFTEPNHVWASDITYIPMAHGFLYLVTIMDWASRAVLAWRLSNTMDTGFCIAAFEEALARHGKPKIFNTDQGAQFTSAAFTGKLEAAGIAISMDGRGRFMDNIFIERLWRSMRYEEVHLKAYADGREARAGIGSWMIFYNCASEHPSVYVTEEKRFCWSGCDPAGYFGFCRARSAMAWAADVVSAARAKIQRPSGKGWTTSTSPASAAGLSVLVVILRSCAALLRLSHGSIPSSAGLCTGI